MLGAAMGMTGGMSASGGAAGPSANTSTNTQSTDSSWNVSFGSSRLDALQTKGQDGKPVDLLQQYLPLAIAVGVGLVLWAAVRR